MAERFDDVRAHCDLSDDFFPLFLDLTQTYSCASPARFFKLT